MDSDALAEYLNDRLNKIQNKRNFRTDLGAEQVKDFPEAQADYARFSELLRLVRKFRIPIALAKVEDPKVEDEVYFSIALGSGLCKIGHSKNPHKRCKAMQTGNPNDLTVIAKVPGGRELEQLVLRHTIKYRRTVGGTEWRVLSKRSIHDLVQKIKTQGTNFLYGPCANYGTSDEHDYEDQKEEAFNGKKNIKRTD